MCKSFRCLGQGIPFESDDDEVDHKRTNVTEYTPPNIDQTLSVPTAVKAIMAEDINMAIALCGQIVAPFNASFVVIV